MLEISPDVLPSSQGPGVRLWVSRTHWPPGPSTSPWAVDVGQLPVAGGAAMSVLQLLCMGGLLMATEVSTLEMDWATQGPGGGREGPRKGVCPVSREGPWTEPWGHQ